MQGKRSACRLYGSAVLSTCQNCTVPAVPGRPSAGSTGCSLHNCRTHRAMKSPKGTAPVQPVSSESKCAARRARCDQSIAAAAGCPIAAEGAPCEVAAKASGVCKAGWCGVCHSQSAAWGGTVQRTETDLGNKPPRPQESYAMLCLSDRQYLIHKSSRSPTSAHTQRQKTPVQRSPIRLREAQPFAGRVTARENTATAGSGAVLPAHKGQLALTAQPGVLQKLWPHVRASALFLRHRDTRFGRMISGLQQCT